MINKGLIVKLIIDARGMGCHGADTARWTLTVPDQFSLFSLLILAYWCDPSICVRKATP